MPKVAGTAAVLTFTLLAAAGLAATSAQANPQERAQRIQALELRIQQRQERIQAREQHQKARQDRLARQQGPHL